MTLWLIPVVLFGIGSVMVRPGIELERQSPE
jgi:hypothetical protein